MKNIGLLLALISSIGLWANYLPDAEGWKLLEKWAKASQNYQRRTPQTVIFTRAQLKYGLERNDYLHRWSDRPLMQDSSLKGSGIPKSTDGSYRLKGFINGQSYLQEAAILQSYGLAGFAFFPESKGRLDILNYAGTPGAEIKLLPEYFFQFKKPTPADIAKRVEIAGLMLNNPQSFRIDGKVVLTTYPLSEDSEYWRTLREALKKRFGDKFLVIPWGTFDFKQRPTGKNKTYTVADLHKMRAKLRQWLRCVDGFYYNSPAMDNRRYQAEFDRKVVIPIIHSVLMEPEFRHKYLGWGTKVGHMNTHELGYAIDAAGTETLRGTMESALLAKADFINCVEWDEENENTCFRPIVTTGFSTLRLVRYYHQAANKLPVKPLPEDDLRIPNLVVSFRRIVQGGQPIEVEVANIPDGSAKKDMTVNIVLTDQHGRELQRFKPQKLTANRPDAVRYWGSAAQLLRHQIVKVKLEVNYRGKQQTFGDSFCPIELRSNWNWDYLWVKHVLREQLPQVQAELKLTPRADGLVELTGEVQSPTKLRSVEVLDGCDVVYSHDAARQLPRTDDQQIVWRISFQAHQNTQLNLLPGSSFKWHNCAPRLVAPARCKVKKERWLIPPHLIQVWPTHIYAVMPRQELAHAQLQIDFPGICQQTVALNKLMPKGIYGIGGRYGFNLVVEPFYSQVAMPRPINRQKVQFRALVKPKRASSVYHVQLVDEHYRLWRGAVQTLYRPSGQTATLHFYDVKSDKTLRVPVDKNLLTCFDYHFSPRYGSVLWNASGQEQYGILGGFSPLAAAIGQGETIYGNAVHRQQISRRSEKDFIHTAPQYVKDSDGQYYLHFDGNDFGALPLSLIPPFGGYTVEIVLRPASGKDTQTILSNGNTAFDLKISSGIPVVTMYRNQNFATRQTIVRAYGPRLKAGKWNKLAVKFDQQKLFIVTNGERGQSVTTSGYHRYSRAALLGADERRGNFFVGDIKSLKITPF